MRWRWCHAALWTFLRRWAAYLVVGVVVLVAGMPGGIEATLTAAQALSAWLVLPLFRAATEPGWIVPAIVLQAVAGAGLVWGARPLLWPARWAANERALPLAPRESMVSDLVIVALALLPLTLLCAIGAHTLLASDPPWLHASKQRAIAALCGAVAGSLWLGVAILQWLRAAPRLQRQRSGARQRKPAMTAARNDAMHPVGWWAALLWWPLWRGPAKRSGRAMCVGMLALCLLVPALLVWPAAVSWWLAAHALLALLVVTRLHALAKLELAPLLLASSPLPLPMASLRWARNALVLLPLWPSLLLPAVLPHNGVRPGAFAAYLLVCVGSCLAEVNSRTTDAAGRSSRWLFSLVLMLALASEVMA